MLNSASALALVIAGLGAGPQPVSPLAIPEIIVTARRREEVLDRVPIAVTVVDADAISRTGITTLEEVARLTPGFSFNAATGRGPNSNRPAVRGLTTVRVGLANSSVAATFIDGVYLGGSSQSTALHDLERVEILRGPQAAQFGRATYAGAINYVTRTPGESWDGQLAITGGSHDLRRASVWAAGPLADERLGLLVSGGYSDHGGEVRNTVDQSRVGGEETRNLGLKLVGQPGANVDIALRIGWQGTDDDHFSVWLQPRTDNNCCFRTLEAPRAREYFIGEARSSRTVTLGTDALEAAGGAGFKLDRWLASLRVDQNLAGGHSWLSLTGMVLDDLERGFDASYGNYDPVPLQPGSFLQRDELRQRDFSQELRLVSPATRSLRWLAGLYYYAGRLEEIAENRVVRNADGTVSVLPNFGDLAEQQVTNHAVFGSLEWELSDGLTTALELRYAADTVRLSTTPNVGATGTPARYEATFHSVTPRFTIIAPMMPRLTPYLSIARGTNPGTFNTSVPPLADGSPDERYREVNEESLWSYEVGLRGRSRRDQASFAVALYRLDVDDQQFSTIVELADGRTATAIGNVGRTQVDGVEFELLARLAEGLRLDATYAYTDSRIRQQLSEEQADLQGSEGSAADLLRLGSVAGNRTPRVPVHMGFLALEYVAGLGAGSAWRVGADWSYESSRYAQEHNLIATGDRHLLGAHLGLARDRLDLRLWVTNLLADDTPVDIIRFIDGRFGTLPSFPQVGASRASATPRGFGIGLPRGREAGVTVTWRMQAVR